MEIMMPNNILQPVQNPMSQAQPQQENLQRGRALFSRLKTQHIRQYQSFNQLSDLAMQTRVNQMTVWSNSDGPRNEDDQLAIRIFLSSLEGFIQIKSNEINFIKMDAIFVSLLSFISYLSSSFSGGKFIFILVGVIVAILMAALIFLHQCWKSYSAFNHEKKQPIIYSSIDQNFLQLGTKRFIRLASSNKRQLKRFRYSSLQHMRGYLDTIYFLIDRGNLLQSGIKDCRKQIQLLEKEVVKKIKKRSNRQLFQRQLVVSGITATFYAIADSIMDGSVSIIWLWDPALVAFWFAAKGVERVKQFFD